MASSILETNNFQAVRAATNIVGANVKSVTWRIDENPSIAEIELPRRRFHEFRLYNAGKRIWIKIFKNRNHKILINGWLTGRSFEYASDSETVALTVQDCRWHMQGDFLKGKYMLRHNSAFDLVTGHKCVFNEKIDKSVLAPGNAAKAKVPQNGIRPFSLDPLTKANCQAFTVNEMLWYTYLIGRIAHLPNIVEDCLTMSEHGIGTLGDLAPYDVPIDGLSITAAMAVIFKRAGLRWWTRAVDETYADLRAFIAGPDGDTPLKYLNLAYVTPGVSPTYGVILPTLTGTRNNTEAGRMQEDYADVYNDVTGYGGRRKIQAVYTFKPGWLAATSAALLATDIANIRLQTREKTSTNWTLYQDVGRKWVLDETGSVAGTAYNFSSNFGSAINWAETWRPFLGDQADGTKKIVPLATNPASGTPEKLENSIKQLTDRAGLVLEGDELPPAIFDEKTKALASVLTMELAVLEDVALSKNATEGGTATGFLVGFIDTNETLTRRKALLVEEEYQTTNKDAVEKALVETKLQDFVTRKLEETKSPKVSSSFSIPWITTAYELGDRIGGILGRNLYFTGQIIEIRFDFDSQRTELILEDLRQAES